MSTKLYKKREGSIVRLHRGSLGCIYKACGSGQWVVAYRNLMGHPAAHRFTTEQMEVVGHALIDTGVRIDETGNVKVLVYERPNDFAMSHTFAFDLSTYSPERIPWLDVYKAIAGQLPLWGRFEYRV